MIKSHSTVATNNGSRYLTQLCKHWSHKFETEYDANSGSVTLPLGKALFAATNSQLSITIECESENLDRLKDVVIRHLERFAFKEAPLTYSPWT